MSAETIRPRSLSYAFLALPPRRAVAPVVADKQDLTTAQLHDMASEQKIPGRSSMDHDELAAAVSPR
jgi:hypothetical protein